MHTMKSSFAVELMGLNSLLFSFPHFFSVVILLGSSVLIQHDYLLAAGLIIASGNVLPPLHLICLLPLIMRRRVGSSNLKVVHSSSILKQLVVAVSGVTACAGFTRSIQGTLLHLKEYSSLMFVNESFLQTVKIFSKNWVLGAWSTIRKALKIFTSIDDTKRWYQPSLGVRWYLDAQMIPEYSLYFELLFLLQPMVCAGLIYFYVIDKDRTVGIHIMMVILLLFGRDLVVLDFVFGIALLLQHKEIIRGMHNLPVIVAGIAVPLALSPLMLSLWVDWGTGNANYFFFQGLCLWLFSALGIVEFTSSFMRSVALQVKDVSDGN